MRKIFALLLPLVAAFLFQGCLPQVADGEHEVVICATTDIHGAYFSKNCDGKPAATSMSNVSAYIKTLRASGINPVLVDVGDNLQGDNAAYYFNYVAMEEPHIFPRIAEYIGYDAIILGNHDIEAGHEVYDRIRKETNIPYLAANAANDKDANGVADIEENGSTAVSDSYFLPYCVVERSGIRVAVIGMTNANIKSWLGENKWRGIDFLRISDFAQEQVDEVIFKEHPQLVVLAMHSGTGDEDEDFENEGLYLAANLKNVDVLLSGHDHSPVARYVDNIYGGKTVLLNEGNKAANVGQATITVTTKGGRVVDKKASYKLVPMKEYDPDEEYDNEFRKDYEAVSDFANSPVGRISDNVYLADALDGPSSYINLIQTVQLASTGADISFAAPLSSSGVIRKGEVLFNDLVTIYRFENSLYVVELTGKQVKDYLEDSYDMWVNRRGPSYNYDSAAGINYEVSRSAKRGKRVRIKSMSDGRPFDESKTYRVAMTSYRANGGGDLLTRGAKVDPDKLVVVDKLPDIRTLIGDYFRQADVVRPKVSDNWKFVK